VQTEDPRHRRQLWAPRALQPEHEGGDRSEGMTVDLSKINRPALAELGYEVRDTMATAWARDGRLVVQKPGATDYGVELGAPADLARLQVRLVGSDRPSVSRSAERDRDMETIRCSDFDRLSHLLGGRGGEMVIEHALDCSRCPLDSRHP
jgi:hypothetical protein